MDKDKIRDWLVGPMVAVATPFKEDFSLNLEALHENVRFMVDHGVRTGDGSLLVGGAAGEHPTLNLEERKAVMDCAMEAADGEVPVLTSIQHVDVRMIVELAKHASKIGIEGAQLGPTYYYVPAESDVQRLFKLVSEESDVTLMIYHTHWEGLTMSMDLLKELADMPTVRALKWSAPDDQLYDEGLIKLADKLVIIDNEGRHVWSHILGARGFVTHISGFWPEYPRDLWRLLEARDYVGAKKCLAQFKWQWAGWRDRVLEFTGGEGPFIKAAMEAVGLRAGPPRPPSARPPEPMMTEIKDMITRAGVPRAIPNEKI